MNTERASDVQRFIRFPFELYRGCPPWALPLWRNLRLALDRIRVPDNACYNDYQT